MTAKAAAFTISATGYTLPLGARYAGISGTAPDTRILVEFEHTPGHPFPAARDWAPIAPPQGDCPGIEIRYTGIWATTDPGARVELRQMTP
jgi:hypothetical protein